MPNLTYAFFGNGYPGGRIGLYSSNANIKFDSFRAFDLSQLVDSLLSAAP
jgi:hypothetical protein